MILADTSYLLALLMPDDALSIRARSWIKVLDEALLVTEHVLWETTNALSGRLHRHRVAGFLYQLRSPDSPEVVYASHDLFEEGSALHLQRPDKEWSLTDCLSFVVMQRRGITRALTYDHHFEQAGFEALLRRDPA